LNRIVTLAARVAPPALAAFVALATVASCAPVSAQPVVSVALPPPWGQHTPGVATHVVVDSTREDAHVAGQPRRILVRVWYPTDSTAGSPRPYMPAAVADAWRATMPAAPGFQDAVRTHSVVDAPVSTAREKWPVLLFSHGRSFPVENYQIALEQLASQGWVIAAISHPYEEALTRLPDGSELPFRGPTWSDEADRGRVLTGVVDELVRDASLVIDTLEALDGGATSRFAGRLDLAAGVGYFGHSLGGAAAVWTMQRDPRVNAAASWEGQVYLDADRPLRVRAPVLYFIAGANRAELMGTQFRPAPGGGPVFELVMHGAWHASFGDMLHVYGHYADAPWHERHRRELDPLRANRITVEYLHEFFGHYLLGLELDLLWPDSGAELGSYRTWNYPEIELRVYAG
jgi:dienelactone hydrolase